MRQAVAEAVGRYGKERSAVLAVLRALQKRFGYLPMHALDEVAKALELPLAQVQGVAEFYSFLAMRPQGQYRVFFSTCIVDEFKGRAALQERLCARLGVPPGQTRADGRVSVNEAACTGLCDQGPSLLVNGWPIARLTPESIDAIACFIDQGVPLEEWPREWFAVQDSFRVRGLQLNAPWRSGAALKRALRHGPEFLLRELEVSGLRGRGGAGFPTAAKWRYCREAQGERCVVCNADEGEPGTFKDRELLKHCADQVFEGMTLAAWATGAQKGFLYLRGEYEFLWPHLEQVLRGRRRRGLLGRNLCGLAGFHFDIAVVVGAGAYICGEESALLNSIEGRRGTPRNRPPYPVTHGLCGQPTVVNNVETFFSAALIALHGGAWFAQAGTAKSRGTRLFSISGDCAWPGIYELPWGISVQEALELCGADDALGVQVGGPSGAFVGPRDFHRRLAFEDLPTGGSFMVFSRQRKLLDIVENFSAFFAHESCGFCTPCRVGTQLQLKLVRKLRRGWGTLGDLQELERLGQVLEASHCGLGHTAAHPVRTTLAAYPEVYQAALREIDFSPGFDLDAELETARQLTGRFADHLAQE
ncbi:MAG: NAD(P)H-dependent oxidoreductase subunit E [Methylohalobius sp.]|nr:NAD(P)H-dependent oxidoreductase subunit E [Methylohalobius sp.]